MPEAEATQADVTETGAEANQQQQEPFVWAKWLESQPEEVRGGYEDDVRGLKNALHNERLTREGLEKRLKTLTGEVEKGSKLQQDLEKLGGDLAEANTKINFFKEAATAKVIDPDLAWLAAKNGNLFGRNGEVDMRALREAHPALFAPAKTPVPPANAGNGRGQETAQRPDMNAAIRNMAGRG